VSIQNLLDKIKSAVYGKDVRQSIHDAIKQAYDDASLNGNANMEVSLARGKEVTLGSRLEKMQAVDNNLSVQLEQRPVKGNIAVSDINKNLGKFDQTYMSDTFLQQIVGNTPINAVPADESITSEKFAPGAVTPDKLAKSSIQYKQLKNPFAKLMHESEITVDFQKMEIRVNNPDSLFVYDETYFANYASPENAVPISLSGLEGLINPDMHPAYRLYIDKMDNRLKIDQADKVTGEILTLALIYKENVRGNQEGIIVIGKDGRPKPRYRLDNGVINPKAIRHQLAHILVKDSIEINFKEKLVRQRQGVLLVVDNSYVSVPTSAFANVLFPASYSQWNATYKLYYDQSTKLAKVTNIAEPTGDNPIIAIFYGEDIVCESYHAVYGIGSNGNRIYPFDYAPVKLDKLVRPTVTLLHPESLEINFQTRKIRVSGTSDLYIFTDNAFGKYGTYQDEVDFSHLNLSGTDYASYFVYLDRTDNNSIKIGLSQQTPENIWVIARVYQHNVIGNERGVKVIDRNGNKVNRYEGISTDVLPMDFGYIYEPNKIDIRAHEKKIVWTSASNGIIGANGACRLSVPSGHTEQVLDYSTTTEPSGYVRILYYDHDEQTLKVKMFNNTIRSKRATFVALFWTSGDSVELVTHFNNERRLKINGKTYAERVGTVAAGEEPFDWPGNYFLLPKELHLLKGVDYSINAHGFNKSNVKEHDKLKFEVITPTQVNIFEDTATISSPVEAVMNTRLGGIYNGQKTNALYKVLRLNFADPSKASGKRVRVLMIGDSITNGDLPPNVKWWLQKFGLIPTMIGTVTNGHKYGLGLEGIETGVKGEGRGGWRITDFTGTTKRKDGTTFQFSYNPFLNPDSKEFDFSYYMNNNGFDGLDYVVIMLGTNDISGYHPVATEQNIASSSIEEILAYMPTEYQKIINSIHDYNPNIKIGFNPPPLAGYDSGFNTGVKMFTEVLQGTFDGVQENIFCLANYLSNGQLTGKTHSASALTEINSTGTLRGTVSNDVHDHGPNTTLSALWTASWIVNMEATK